MLSASKTKPCRLTCSLPSPLTLNQHFMRLRYGFMFKTSVTKGFDTRNRRHRQAGGCWDRPRGTAHTCSPPAPLTRTVPDLVLLRCPQGHAITALLNQPSGFTQRERRGSCPQRAAMSLTASSSGQAASKGQM